MSKDLAKKLFGLSFAEIEDFCTDLLRKSVLDGPDARPKEILSLCLKKWEPRFREHPHFETELPF